MIDRMREILSKRYYMRPKAHILLQQHAANATELYVSKRKFILKYYFITSIVVMIWNARIHKIYKTSRVLKEIFLKQCLIDVRNTI